MLKLNEKEYNLDILIGINFELLKEVLLGLSKNDNMTSIEINDLKNNNISLDKRISDLEQKITELKEKERKYIIKDDKQIEISIEGNKDNNNIIINTNKEIIKQPEKKYEFNYSNNNNKISIEKINDLFISNEELNQLDGNHPNTEKNITIENENKIENKKDIEKEKSKSKIPLISSYYKENPRINKKYKTAINIMHTYNPLFSPTKNKEKLNEENETPKNIIHIINELKDHINYVEQNLLIKNTETLKTAKDLLSEHNIQSVLKFNSINEELAKLNSKQEQLNKVLRHLNDKKDDNISINLKDNNNNKEIIQIFNDEEENNNDKNIIPKDILNSINKRFEFNNERYLKAFEENYKIKSDISNIKGILDNITRQNDSLKNENEKIKENIKKLNEQLDEIYELKNKDNNTNNINLNNIEKINKYINKKVNELLEKFLQENNEGNNKEKSDININTDNIMDKALINIMNKKINEINENISLIDEDLNLLKKNFNKKFKDIDKINTKLEEIDSSLQEKLVKKDLNELYNMTRKNTDEVNNMRLKVEEIYIGQEKIRNDNPHFIKRLESLTNEVSQIKEILNLSKGNYKVIHNEYNTKVETKNENETLTEEKLKNILAPVAEEIEKLITEIEKMDTKLKNVTEQNKSFVKKKYLEKLESDLNDKINILENYSEAKYLKKIEFQKIMKITDIQIKQLQGNNNNSMNQKNESENWILAKQPLKCFNCASCEAKINNQLQQNDFLPWSKYHGQYRLGQGFSKLLKKLDVKINEEKDSDKNKILNSSFEDLKINHKIINENDRNIAMSLKKYKLPRLIESFRKKQKSTDIIPITDDEKEEKVEVREASPQIVKIKKLKNEDIANQIDIHNLKNRTGRNSDHRSNNINRVQSLPAY